jgi:hypothetical protein
MALRLYNEFNENQTSHFRAAFIQTDDVIASALRIMGNGVFIVTLL